MKSIILASLVVLSVPAMAQDVAQVKYGTCVACHGEWPVTAHKVKVALVPDWLAGQPRTLRRTR